jgi:hypothetical protein
MSGILLTFLFMELRVQCQGDFSRADMQQLILVVLSAAEFSDNLAEGIVLGRAEGWEIVNDEVVNGENVRKFDVQRRLRTRKQIVELINLVLHLGVANFNHCTILAMLIRGGSNTYS